jgi:hypothetical protein
MSKRKVTLSDINWKRFVLSLNQLSCYAHSGWKERKRHSSQINIQFNFQTMSSLQLYVGTQHRLWQKMFIFGDNKNLSHRSINVSILNFSVKWVYLTRLFNQKLLFWISSIQGVKRIFQDCCMCVCACVRARLRACSPREYPKLANVLP